jgi:CubicO group peptidase (beta-lactamase class C family)
LAKGYGVRRLGGDQRVTANTLFLNGSTGKAFTSAALAILVDQGKLKWDDKVVDHMPWFAMHDPWVTREMTVRDLLVHRSGLGLGAGDMLFVPSSNLSRKETVRRLRYIKPATSFRSGYAYDNILYAVAGQLIEEVSGQTWEKFVDSQVLRPAGMRNSTADPEVRFRTADRAQPHARFDGGLRGLGTQVVLNERDELGRNAAPAGGLAVSANDMSRWLVIQLGKGRTPEGGRLFSEGQSAEMWKPVVIQPVGAMPADMKVAQPMFSAYALGWNVRDYRGAKLVTHDGAVFGMQATVVLIPEKNVGFTIMINSEDGETVRALMYQLLDHYLGLPTQDWTAAWRGFKADRLARAKTVLASVAAQTGPAQKVGPSLPLERYAGDYADPWYGPIAIRHDAGRLTVDFRTNPGLNGTLEHHQFDTFRTRWSNPGYEPAYLTFALDADGKIAHITAQPVSPVADFSWDYRDLEFKPVAAP